MGFDASGIRAADRSAALRRAKGLVKAVTLIALKLADEYESDVIYSVASEINGYCNQIEELRRRLSRLTRLNCE